jgi:hypothetical protein
MRKTIHPGPATPFYKVPGKWTFYVFPNGIPEEANEYTG